MKLYKWMQQNVVIVGFLSLCVGVSIAWAAAAKISALTADATPGTDSLLVTVDDPGGSPATRKSTIAQVLSTGNLPSGQDASKITSPGSDGELIYNNSGTMDGTTSINLKIDGALASDNTYSGFVITGRNAGESVSQWTAVFQNPTDSEWHNADADAAGEWPMRGVAVAAGTDGNPLDVLVIGIIRNDAWNWTIGGALYLSDSVGAITQTAPSTSTDCVQVVGFALTADMAYINITGDWYEVP